MRILISGASIAGPVLAYWLRKLDYHYRDVARQKELLRNTFQGLHPDVDHWLTELDGTPTFYFDSITQLHLDTWSRGRVTLVGDAGYCPGPAVGGSTTLAVVGAYVLAGELARAGGDHERAFPAYERVMAPHIQGSRAAALSAAKTLIPASRLGIAGLVHGARLLSALPAGPRRALLRLAGQTGRLYNSMTIDNYEPAARLITGAEGSPAVSLPAAGSRSCPGA